MFILPPIIQTSTLFQKASTDSLLDSFNSSFSFSSNFSDSFSSSNQDFASTFSIPQKIDLEKKTSIYRFKKAFSLEPLFSDSDFESSSKENLINDQIQVLDLEKTTKNEEFTSLDQENLLEENPSKNENLDAQDLENRFPLDQEELLKQDLLNELLPATVSIAKAPFDHEGVVQVNSRNITIEFLKEMDSYWLCLQQADQKEIIPLQGFQQSLCLNQNEALLILFDTQNEKVASWNIQYISQEGNQFFQESPLSNSLIKPDEPLPTTDTLIVPLEVESHETPFITQAMQPTLLEKEESLVFNEPFKPLILEDLEEEVLPTNLSHLKSDFIREDLLKAKNKAPEQIDSLISYNSSLASTSAPSSPTFAMTSSVSSSSLGPKESTPSSSTSNTFSQLLTTPSLATSALQDLSTAEKLPSVEKLAYPPSDSIASPSSLDSTSDLKSQSENIKSEKTSILSNSSLRTYLAKNLENKVTQPIVTIQQAGKVIDEGNTLYVKKAEDIKVDVKNGALQNLTVRSKETKKNYIDLQSAMEAEKQAIFEIEASAQGTDGSQSSQAKWTVIPIGEPLKQSLSLPTQEIENFYSLDETGKLSSYRQAPPASIVLCRGFEPLESQSVTPGETLRVYVDQDLENYSLSINGKSQEIKVSQDELGQRYVPISVKAGRTDISLKQNGKMVYSNSLQANNPLFSWGWIAPLIGSVTGLVLDGRRRRAL